MSLLLIGAMAASLLAAGGSGSGKVEQSPPDRSSEAAVAAGAPVDGDYLYMGKDTNGDSDKVYSYASAPQDRVGNLVSSWYIDVLAHPVKEANGVAAYAAALYRFDCTRGVSRLEGAVFYDARGKVLRRANGETWFGKFDKGSIGDRMHKLNCDEEPTAYPLKGVPAVLHDAISRNPDATA